MGFKRTAFTLICFILYWMLAHSMPISFEDNSIHYSDNKSNRIIQVSEVSCSCGFYESDEIDSNIMTTMPLVSLKTYQFAQCNYKELVACQDRCTSSSDLLMKQLCKEKGHWITKQGCIFGQFCDESRWFNTGACINEENLTCCHNGKPANCSQIDVGDGIAYVLNRLFSKLFSNNKEQSATETAADDTDVPDLKFSVDESGDADGEKMKAVDFVRTILFDLDSDDNADENTETYIKDMSSNDYFELYPNLTPAPEDEHKRIERHTSKVITKTNKNHINKNDKNLSESQSKTDNITFSKDLGMTNYEIPVITTETANTETSSTENPATSKCSGHVQHHCSCTT